MRFGNPEFFLLLFLLPLFAGFFIWAFQRKRAALRRFASLDLIGKLTPSSSITRQVVKCLFFCAFFLFMTIALTRPRFGAKMEMVERKGIDIMVALDISQSMLAEDIAPNRIDRAKHEIAKLIDMLKGDRIGIIVFAGESYVQCPLTLDYGAAKMFLSAVSTGWVEVQGTALGDAIKQASEAFRSKARKHKVMILISDGEDHEGKAVDAAKAAAEEGVIIYTVGVGSESGVPVPVSRGSGNVIYKKDASGSLVMTRLDPVILEKIAVEGKGKYFHAGTDLSLSEIMKEISGMEKKDFGTANLATFEERYQIFLLIALIMLMVEFFISERSVKKHEWKGRFE
ncbi:MAG TPA: VWA domain-containing protein [Chitinispirillaceae bacterium]|nr:VWA domain-containing protein [Chitinispirillaceae bacterium]